MSTTLPNDPAIIQRLARAHNLSEGAVYTLLQAMMVGQGRQAQFNHPELGGMGQWQAGGMLMIGDMFNHALKARVAALCSDLAAYVASLPPPATSKGSIATTFGARTSNWWPPELGTPAATGSQQGIRYAYFAATRLLAIEHLDQVTVYDTLDHSITGVAQQQGGQTTLAFTSQKGTISLSDLPIVSRYPATR